MKWLKWAGGIVGVILLLLAAIPFFISLDDYIPRIEREVSARIKQPVKIAKLRAAGLPIPHVVVSGISVGKTGDIKVGRVAVTPDLMSLLDTTRVIRSIEIQDLVLTHKALDKIAAWTRADAKPGATAEPPAVRVESIRLDNAVIRLQQAALGPFDARLSLAANGSLESAALTSDGGKLKVRIKPDRSWYLIDASAKGWTLPVGAPIRFDELAIKGVTTLKGANFGEVRARLYGGTVAGTASIGWQKGMQIKGSAEVNQVEVSALLRALGHDRILSGRLTAKPVFSVHAPNPLRIMSLLRLETPFDIENGVLHRVDISKAATALPGKDAAKGITRFDQLSGHLTMEQGTRRLTKLNVASGGLSANGSVTISPNDELSGRINATVKAVKFVAGAVPLNVSGTLDSPTLYPTGGTVAGAAAGTAVLGPGVGTALGAKLGQWVERLFGTKEEEKK